VGAEESEVGTLEADSSCCLTLLTSHPLSLTLTLTLVRPEFSFLLCFLWAAYRDCFHVFFLSLCVFFFSSGFARGGLVTHNLSSLPGLAFFCNQLAYCRLVIRRAVEMVNLVS